MVCDSVLLGGGNAKLMQDLPTHVILGANSNAIDGGIKLWQDPPIAPKAATSLPVKAPKASG
jgi:polyphosphate glucokinase